MSQSPVGTKKQIVLLPFAATDITDANGTLISNQATTNDYVMPFPGSILGMTSNLNGTLVTGTLNFQAVINGSLSPAFPDAASVRANQQRGSYTQEAYRSNFIFSAGQRLGLMYQKAGTIAPETRDGNFMLVVLLDKIEY